VVNDVQPADGKLAIYALLNSEIPSHKAPARKICRVANASGLPEAKGAVVLDAGGILLLRC
jgi:hypothetical protein